MKGITVLCTAAALCAFPAVASAQLGIGDLPWSDGLEAYADGSVLNGQGPWEAWDEDPAAAGAIASSAQAHTGNQSIRVTNVDDAVVLFDIDGADGTGVFKFSAWSWLPETMTDNTYFILLNQYSHGGTKNWSLDLEMNAATGKVIDFESGNETDLVLGEWVRIEVIIDLINDACEIIYNGQSLGGRGWSQGGLVAIQCLDLWGDNTTSNVYYDDILLEELPAEGACCFPDGSCSGGQSPTDCDTAGGSFEGFGVGCAGVSCPVDGPNGWIVDAPLTWNGDTCEEANDCSLRSGNDEQWELTLPYDGEWTFSVCGALWDTWMALADDAGCSSNIAFNDDAAGCGVASEITMSLSAGTYYLTLEGLNDQQCGGFTLQVTGVCSVELGKGQSAEGEADCSDPDVFNSGCNGPVGMQNWSPISCGDSVVGTTGNFTNAAGNPARDTDWYAFSVDGPTDITYTGFGEDVFQQLFISPGSQDPNDPAYCDGLSIDAFAQPAACAEGVVNYPIQAAGVYWLWAGAQGSGLGIPCGSAYEISLSCTPIVIECPTDLDGDNDTDFQDLLQLLSNYGTPNGDVDGDGDTDFQDLLQVLSNFGPC